MGKGPHNATIKEKKNRKKNDIKKRKNRNEIIKRILLLFHVHGAEQPTEVQ